MPPIFSALFLRQPKRLFATKRRPMRFRLGALFTLSLFLCISAIHTPTYATETKNQKQSKDTKDAKDNKKTVSKKEADRVTASKEQLRKNSAKKETLRKEERKEAERKASNDDKSAIKTESSVKAINTAPPLLALADKESAKTEAASTPEKPEEEKVQEKPVTTPAAAPTGNAGFLSHFHFNEPTARMAEFQVAVVILLIAFCLIIALNFARLKRLTVQLLLNTRMMQESQRAFVLLKSFEARMEDNRLIIIPYWENYGNTPAINLEDNVSWAFRDSTLPDNFKFLDKSLQTKPSGVLAPHTTSAAVSAEIDVKYIDPLLTQKGHIYIWGWIEYNDIFMFTDKHRTEFCQEVLISKTPTGEISVQFREHKLHNQISSRP